MIKKVLVANRGEIAVRVMRSCREMGIHSVAVFSDADRSSMHVRYANEAYHIGPSPSTESYLDQNKIIEVAKKTGADAIHPGYGFLSENATFSQRCKDEGIIFIGPDKEVIATMGDKITARETMIKSGVPVVPGTNTDLNTDELALKTVAEIGLPVMLKASAGGGGKGMRLVKDEKDILSSLRSAKSEALASFGDGTVYVEKFIANPHHIEFQILADQHGNVIHLCERECSVQRRHQKVVEETPSPLMTEKIRQEMGEYAVAAAKSVNYVGAGTIEFLVDNDLNYYFLEMNTRLQVEHPITERVIGIDLVKEQIRVAQGEKLSMKQEDVVQKGHAIECRIYAEDPDNNFMPSPGVIKHLTEPLGLGVRQDGYVYEGFEIPIYYDPMISKLIVWGNNRDEAIQRMRRALYEYKITGIKTSIKFLEKIMETPDFISGKYDTGFIEKNDTFLFEKRKCDSDCLDISMIVAMVDYQKRLKNTLNQDVSSNGESGWKKFGKKTSMNRF
ncbi:MAG: acetyl-CoA carboxylase biotin carboxylase subunit [Bacteroidales bacterium]|nr:acetyl-CoA carboxylase biotin carboxylase subunit [Bacteroidales bacterium]